MRRLLFCAAPLRCLVFCAGCPAGCFPMEFCSNAPASNSSVTVSTASSIFPIALRTQRPCQPLRRSAPASNKPHSAEKSTPVWLAIWRTWAGFANSQLLPDAAALSSMQGLPRSGNSSAQTSASLHPLQRPGQQQTSSGGEKYSGLASNLAHLGRIC